MLAIRRDQNKQCQQLEPASAVVSFASIFQEIVFQPLMGVALDLYRHPSTPFTC
jgi:hypothetical protein